MATKITTMGPLQGAPQSSRPWQAGSRLADRRAMDQVAGQAQEIPIAQMRTDDAQARAWRVTLSRLDRIDQHAPLAPNDPGNSSPAWVSKIFQYAAGVQQTPAVPPRRSNPVFGLADPSADIEPVFVELAWGMSEAAPNRIIANWPAQGASIVLVGSYVEVFGAAAVFGLGTPPISTETFPVFEATIAPAEGVAVEDAAELSLQQNIGVAVLVPEVLAELALTPLAIPVTDGILTETWDATLTWDHETSKTFTLNYGGAAGVEVRENESWSGVAWGALANNVGVRIGGAAVTVTQAQNAINAAGISGLVVSIADAPHAAWTFPADVLHTGAFSDGACATQGGAVYVPDYARRVRVTLALQETGFCGNEWRVPITGNPKSQLVWYDDQGNVVDAVLQCCPDWQPVPARAVMLGVYGDPANVVPYIGIVHWRISP